MDKQIQKQILSQCKPLAEKGVEGPENRNLSKQEWQIIGKFSDLFEELNGNITSLIIEAGLSGKETTWLIEMMVRHRYGLLQK